MTQEIDPLENATSYTYQDFGRHLIVTLADPGGPCLRLSPTVEIFNDEAGNVVSEIDALGGTTSYAYDDLGRLITVTAPDLPPTSAGKRPVACS